MSRDDADPNDRRRVACNSKRRWVWGPVDVPNAARIKGSVKSALFGDRTTPSTRKLSWRDHMEISGEFETEYGTTQGGE